jgi:hypothetical protein
MFPGSLLKPALRRNDFASSVDNFPVDRVKQLDRRAAAAAHCGAAAGEMDEPLMNAMPVTPWIAIAIFSKRVRYPQSDCNSHGPNRSRKDVLGCLRRSSFRISELKPRCNRFILQNYLRFKNSSCGEAKPFPPEADQPQAEPPLRRARPLFRWLPVNIPR